MRGAQLGDHFAHQVIQIAAVCHPWQESFVTRADLFPIVAGHVGIPVEVALDPPGFVEHFAPFLARVDLHLHLIEIQLAFAGFGLAGCGFHDAVDRPGFINDFLAFFIEVVGVDAFEEHFVFAPAHVVNMKDVLRLAVFGAELPRFLRRRNVEKLVFARGKSP